MRIISNSDYPEDDVLIAETEDQMRELGLDEDSVQFQIACLRDGGMFRVLDR